MTQRIVRAVLGAACGAISAASVAAPPKFDAQAWIAQSENTTVEVVAYRAKELWVDSVSARLVQAGALDEALVPDPEALPRNAAALLADKLIARFGAITKATLHPRAELLESSRPGSPSTYRELTDAGYVLDVAVINPLVTYERRQLSSYGYRVDTKVRLIDNAMSTVLWEYDEKFKPQWDDPLLHLTEQEVAAADGRRLREIIDLTFERVADDVVRSFQEGPRAP